MSAADGYGRFLHLFRPWILDQCAGYPHLAPIVENAKIRRSGSIEHILAFSWGPKRKFLICFAQNMTTGDSSSKVFAVEFSVGRYLTVDWLRSAARRDLPEGEAGVYDYGKGEIFYIQTEWGHDGQYELLEQGHTRDMLFAFGLDALIFAVHALEHESRVREREQ